MQKYSRQIVQEQKLRLEPHLTDIVVRLLELNTLQKHPPVAAAWDSRSEQTMVFERLSNASCLHTNNDLASW